MTANQTAQNYALVRYTISGNTGVGGVVLTYTDGTIKKARSAADGSYSIVVLANWSGTVTPSIYGYTFSPANRVYTKLAANSPAQNYKTVLVVISTPVSPTGTLINTPMTKYLWTRIVTASKYQVQLWRGSALVYTQTYPSSVCVTTCSGKPAVSLSDSAYMWRVRAMVGGVWRGYSVFQTFSLVTLPLNGFWSGPGVAFYVTGNENLVEQFSIGITVPACGKSYTITHNVAVSISSRQFSFGGSFYASGYFSSTTYAYGTTGLNRLYISGCGYVSGGPFSWSASWVSADQRASVMPAEVAPLQLSPDLFTVERVDP